MLEQKGLAHAPRVGVVFIMTKNASSRPKTCFVILSVTSLVCSTLACSGSKSAQNTNSRSVSSNAERTSSDRITAPVSDSGDGFEVHEWGVIEITKDQKTGLYGRYARIPERLQEMVAKKPVLYFHTDKKLENVKVRITSPLKFVEWWPNTTGKVDSGGLLYEHLTVDSSAACPSPDRMAINSYCRDDPAADGICERHELESFVADGSCIKIPRKPPAKKTPKAQRESFPPASADLKEVPFLFYRLNQIKPGQAPTDIGPNKGADILVVDQRSQKFWHRIEGGDSMIDSGQAGEWLRSRILKLGLTRPEMAVFMRVWEKDLLQGAQHKRKLELYWLSPKKCDDLIKLDIEPRPKSVHRALLVVQEEE